MKRYALLSLFALTACQPSGSDADLRRFEQWFHNQKDKSDVEALGAFLNSKGVGDVLPIHQLLRSDTNWRKCNAEPFAVPPKALWPSMVPTLKLLRDEVLPLTGRVQAQSVFRAPSVNQCIGGASGSFHTRFRAIDLEPTNGTTRAQLIEKLCALHARKGKALNMGLGIYKGTRFHIDTAGYRSWGHDHRAATSPCIGFVAPQHKLS